MKVILSIKPYYAEKILNGEKTYELRKSIFKVPNIKTVIIYASSPISRIIGEFEIDGIIHEEISLLWKKTKEFTAVNKSFFDEYFTDKEKGYAIKIKNIKRYDKTYSILEKYGMTAPQSFSYTNK
ncbi:MAG: ASCH domain-containing protein [Candidatus Dojkabacteria bacterium]